MVANLTLLFMKDLFCLIGLYERVTVKEGRLGRGYHFTKDLCKFKWVTSEKSNILNSKVVRSLQNDFMKSKVGKKKNIVTTQKNKTKEDQWVSTFADDNPKNP